MDFDSPEVMKDFPGLYSSEKKKGNDNDYNDECEKTTKKDMLIGKRKEKKDKKDKDKGYAALEGESSDEASTCKSKKSKAFKFTKSKDKEKEKHKDKQESSKKNPPKKSEKPHKVRKGFGPSKHYVGDCTDLADALPIFGVDIEEACTRGRCHDGISIPLPVRECVDYIEATGLTFEGVYKVSGPKNKVSQIRKIYNNRQVVRLNEYDVPTATSLLKMFLRDLPEPIFTNELLIRFEEAGAILNYNTREKHLKTLIESLPNLNRLLLGWLIVHLHNVTLKEHINKMNRQALSQALNHTFHISSRLLQALILHQEVLFPNLAIIKYYPPLESESALPDDPVIIEKELSKLESLLSQIHWEMQNGHFSKTREEHLWEVQRVTTELKRKLKKFAKTENTSQQTSQDIKQQSEEKEAEKVLEEPVQVPKLEEATTVNVEVEVKNIELTYDKKIDPESVTESEETANSSDAIKEQRTDSEEEYSDSELSSTDSELLEDVFCQYFDEKIVTLKIKNTLLKDLIESLTENINQEKKEIEDHQKKISNLMRCLPLKPAYRRCLKDPNSFNEVQTLLVRENHMLQIKKLHLVRQVMEQKEQCIDLQAKLKYAMKDNKDLKIF
ncbi:ralA-binding protein 1-like [Sitophilus oryzae]|uniref:RalA-binding protein 1-like n=1 Tax=Sitophilus oryzae TaxID=7048 RepID=A0A6J2XD28_SITOR|nr:ralA-binding protein 1-like [Sitophilus oryzae]XP_030748695.1 ralA-binding protein 1-like [Sitophilus oryzae]